MAPILSFISLLALAAPAFAAFGVTTSSTSYVVDTGSSNGFVVTVKRSSCDITSIKYRGVEYQYQGTYSHIASGLGTVSSSISTISNKYVKIACSINDASFSLTHYLIFRSGDSNIYMATDTSSQPSIGETRFIARLISGLLPLEKPFGDVSNTSGGTSVEGSDVFLVNGQTRSKFYSSERFIDDQVHCIAASDSTVHACMVLSDKSKEKSSGGPFFRDINTNNGGAYNSLYFYMNSGHVQTENYRQGFHGPYTLTFSRNGIPKANEIDTSFFSELSIDRYIDDSKRGYVSGKASGVSSNTPIVVHWYNNDYQYWAYASSSGAFTSPAMVQGTYTMKVYQDEFLAATTSSVTVSPGSAKTQNIAATSAVLTKQRTTVFKIGEYDGRPTGFQNADKQLRMHPSDSRMSAWRPATYTVGSSSVGSFPMALFKSTNSPVTINFQVSSAINQAVVLRIATTLSFASGRPLVTVNKWNGAVPAAPAKIDSRGVTRGAYRGYGEIYEFSIPIGTLVSGLNSITIAVASGSSGDGFLSPNFIFDCVELFY